MRNRRQLGSRPQLTSRAQRAPWRLTIAEVTSDVELDITLGDEKTHAACCERDEFFCGHPFHPELEDSAEGDAECGCSTCHDIFISQMCPPHRPTHLHCPFTGMACTSIG